MEDASTTSMLFKVVHDLECMMAIGSVSMYIKSPVKMIFMSLLPCRCGANVSFSPVYNENPGESSDKSAG